MMEGLVSVLSPSPKSQFQAVILSGAAMEEKSVKSVTEPKHTSVAVKLTVGAGFTNTITVSVFWQRPKLTVTTYCVVWLGLACGDAAVGLSNPVDGDQL